MDKATSYRESIKRLLGSRVEFDNRQATSGVRSMLVADDERGVAS